MRQFRGGHEDEKKIASCVKPVPAASSFDVRVQVMERVCRIHKERQAKRSGGRRMTRRSFLAMAGIIVALSSLTGFAASRYFQITNEKGKVIIKTMSYEAEEKRNRKYQPYQNKLSRQLEKYKPQIQELEEQLRPGEIIAYYIDDDIINTLDTLGKAKFTYKPLKYTDYGQYISRVTEEKKNQPMIPERLTDSLVFEEGILNPDFMFGKDVHENFAEQMKLAEEFEQEAKKAKGDQKIFTKKMPWVVGEEGYLSVLYSDGKSSLRLGISKLSGNSTVQTYTTAQTKVEKIKINGREVIIHDESKSEKKHLEYMAVWYDEKKKYSYSLGVDKENKLSKQDFLEALEALIKP
ncbi:hypothetical protein ABD76_13040 [Paenibacillus dendritiformis]|uniref:DUF4367 domain-containing protein n=1 Tax=Paenibacillus dendritiformis TaxID=130049 RepID=UPI0018CE71CE|nr:DUF4367 domain-containing protein [Paenibacillus dendritiformis]MBG9793368.1 hypothetical protein [Paenibacillus dendritiformis]